MSKTEAPIIEFEKKDAVVKVDISKDKMSAFIVVDPPVNGGDSVNLDMIHAALKDNFVFFGIRRSAIEDFVRKPQYRKPFKVAEGLLPSESTAGRIQFFFRTSKELVPRENPDGSVDFKDLGLVKSVREGDLLCTKVMPVLGNSGFDVNNKELPAKHLPKPILPRGRNTVISSDGQHLLAGRDGQVDLMNDVVCIYDVLTLDEVGPSSGNIDFVGNVVVKGDVLSGYTVRAEGNINVRGCVDGGSIIAGGNVVIDQGFNGQSRGTIDAHGDVRCKYIHYGEVKSDLNIETSMVVNATVQAGGNLRVLGKTSAVLSSKLLSRHTIECYAVGKPNDAHGSVLEVGSDPYILQRSKLVPERIAALETQIEKLERFILLFAQLKAQNRLDEDKTAEYEKMMALRKNCQTELAELTLEKMDLEQRRMTAGYGTVNILGDAQEGTLIIIGSERLLLKNKYSFAYFSRTEKGISVSPAKTNSKNR